MRFSKWAAPLLACAWLSGAAAQTLDEQYDFFLVNSDDGTGTGSGRRCYNMNFQVDANLNLLPGQAGPLLETLCSGPLPVGGISTSSSQGGSSGAASGNGRAAAEDAALRRRRDRLRRNGNQPAEPAGNDFSLLDSGNLNAFLSLDYQYEKRKSTRYEAGHRFDQFTGTLGSDYRFGTLAVAGMALKFESLSGRFASSSGDFDTHSEGAVLYGSWLPRQNFFVDLNAGLMHRSLGTRRVVGIRRVTIASPGSPPLVSFNPALTSVSTRTHNQEASAEFRSGYDFNSGRLTIGPRIAAMWKRTELDGFTERGATPMALVVDAQTETSLQSSAGIQASAAFNTAKGVVVPQLNLDWLHELEDDQRVITAHFLEDLRPNPTRLHFLNEAPDRDVLRIRASAVGVFAHGMSSFCSVEVLAGHAYLDRYSASVGMRFEF